MEGSLKTRVLRNRVLTERHSFTMEGPTETPTSAAREA
jgi:hypothetical protein